MNSKNKIEVMNVFKDGRSTLTPDLIHKRHNYVIKKRVLLLKVDVANNKKYDQDFAHIYGYS